MSLPLAAASMLAELALGYPQWLVDRIGHPVTWIGKAIDAADRSLNRREFSAGRRKVGGIALATGLVLVPGAIGLALERLLLPLPAGLVLVAILASSLVAQRSLASHVAAVAQALETEGLAEGRKAVSMIVGRDPDRLDEAAVCRAAIESLAENFSDGVTAPVIWIALGGLGGGLAYKAVNTADSMVGHRTERHESFGWASARLDDLVNLPASRLTAVLIVAAAALTPGADAGASWRALRRDARRHRSPNAGWPEAAMAGALRLALAGPRVYGGTTVDDAVMGEGGRRDATPADIRRALRLFRTADALLLAVLVAAWLGTALVWPGVHG